MKLAVVKIKDSQLHVGIASKSQARNAFIEGFLEEADKKKDTKYAGYSGFKFVFSNNKSKTFMRRDL